jgi:hypothetical protein
MLDAELAQALSSWLARLAIAGTARIQTMRLLLGSPARRVLLATFCCASTEER